MADVFVELRWVGGVFIILTKPTHCSYVLDPIPLTSFNCSRFTKAPFSSRHAKIAFAFFSFKPAMRLKRKMSRYLSFMAKIFLAHQTKYLNMETPATFKSTPTKLTQSSITPSKASRNNFSGMSCCSNPTSEDKQQPKHRKKNTITTPTTTE